MARTTKPLLAYVDACVFLNVIKREKSLWPDSLKILLAADRGDIQLVASTLLLVEVGSYKGDVDPVKRDKVIDRYLMNGPVRWHELDMFVADEARKLCDPHRLQGADATHLATAIRAKADYFISRDGAFPYGQMVGGVKVVQPTLLWNPTTDDAMVDQEASADP